MIPFPVDLFYIRKHTNNNKLFISYLKKEHQMAQAKVVTQVELDQVLRYVSTKRYAKRDRCLLLISFWSGMRVGEIAQLKMRDVVNEDGTVKNEIKLSAHQTKGNTARVVFIPRKLKEEILDYLTTRMIKNPEIPLFHTDDRLGFTPNSLCQWFFWTYKRAGINGASSHSGRKTFLTSLANKGISIHILASLAGHKSIAVTHRYLIANDEMKRNAVELI
jgi:integrase/recombinase XerD